MSAPPVEGAAARALAVLRTTRGRIGAACGLWLAAAYVILLDANPAYAWHLALYALAALLAWRPQLILPRGGIRPRTAHFVLIAIVWSSLIAMPLATLLRGDLNPNMLVNAGLWLGGMGAIAGVWAWLLRRYRWHTLDLFLVAGLLALTEPSFALLQLARTGQWGAAAVLLPVLHATHACLIAPVANAYRGALARPGASAPGWKGWILAVVLDAVAFTLGTAAWFWLARRVLTAAAG